MTISATINQFGAGLPQAQFNEAIRQLDAMFCDLKNWRKKCSKIIADMDESQLVSVAKKYAQYFTQDGILKLALYGRGLMEEWALDKADLTAVHWLKMTDEERAAFRDGNRRVQVWSESGKKAVPIPFRQLNRAELNLAISGRGMRTALEQKARVSDIRTKDKEVRQRRSTELGGIEPSNGKVIVRSADITVPPILVPATEAIILSFLQEKIKGIESVGSLDALERKIAACIEKRRQELR
jgi:hypothetical protein